MVVYGAVRRRAGPGRVRYWSGSPAVRCGPGPLLRRCGRWWFVVGFVRAEGGYCVVDGLFPLFPSGRVGAECLSAASG